MIYVDPREKEVELRGKLLSECSLSGVFDGRCEKYNLHRGEDGA